jgi:hypothetical protein
MPHASLRPIALLAWGLLALGPASLAAQDSAAVAPAPDSLMKPDSVATAVRDSVLRADSTAIPARSQALATAGLKDSVDRKRPVGPGGALWRSLLVPGWGQAKLGRGIAAGIFIAVEGVSLGMVLKTNSELNYAKATDTTAVANKSQEREDWLVIMAVNHLIAGLEAYVSAHLWDFPGDLALKPVRGGGVAASVNFPVRVP